MHTENKVSNRMPAILLFLLLYFNNETLSNNYCEFVSQPTQYVSGFLIVFALCSYRCSLRYMERSAFFGICVMAGSVMLAFFQDISFSNGYVLTILAVLDAYMIISIMSFEEVARLFTKYMSFFALSSLICTYVLKMAAPLLGVVKTVTNSAGIRFYNFYVAYVVIDEGYYRNLGIFREPGVYAIFLILAICCLMWIFSKKEEKYKRPLFLQLGILVCALVTTFSTTGIVALGMLLVWYGIVKRQFNMKYAIAGLIILTIVYFLNSQYLVSSIDKLSADSSSWKYRMNTIVTGIDAMCTKPFGYGILNGIEVMRNGNQMRYFNNTSTVIASSVYFGVFFMITWVWGMIRFSQKRLGSIVLALPLLLLFNSQMLIYNPFVYMFSFYGLIRSDSRDGAYKIKEK